MNKNTVKLANETLKSHQITAADRKEYEQIENLHTWVERFVFEFKLKTENLPAIIIHFFGWRRYGNFMLRRNGFGKRNEIAINKKFIGAHEFWEVLGALLHKLLHMENELICKIGNRNCHNKAYRERAASLGLIVDQGGHMYYAPAPSPFWDVLAKYGIAAPESTKATKTVVPSPGNSN